MEGAGGKCRQGRQGCRATPDYRPLARRSRSGRRSLRKQTSEPLLKNGVFGKGEKACSRGLKKEFFLSPDTRQARFQCPIALFPKKRISFLTKTKDNKKGKQQAEKRAKL